LRELSESIDRGMLRTRGPLRARLKQLEESARGGKDVSAGRDKLTADALHSVEQMERRRARLPQVMFPEELPISAKRGDIAEAIRVHQVVIVCGETGSGKTTQLPKICLELGRGVQGMIGHTQPRRIAARSVASRIAAELRTTLGDVVGYQVRFNDRTSSENFVKVMTDGILLAETQGERWLSQYDTLIIDEAHERSLNIDFLLGYIKQLLPRRPELKLIITSATIDAERFSRHFDNAPVIEVSGQLYPVDVWYRPFDENDETSTKSTCRSHRRCGGRGDRTIKFGDVLVFLPGEREIREAAEALRKRHPQGAEILPLFARLSAPEQERILPGRRAPHRACHQRGGDLAYRSGNSLCDRLGARPHQPLQLSQQSGAAAGRKRFRGLRPTSARRRCGRVMNGICVAFTAKRISRPVPNSATPRSCAPRWPASSCA
jgi:ATP-dependent helicase HrpA